MSQEQKDVLRDLVHIKAYLNKSDAPEVMMNRFADVEAFVASHATPDGPPDASFATTYNGLLSLAKARCFGSVEAAIKAAAAPASPAAPVLAATADANMLNEVADLLVEKNWRGDLTEALRDLASKLAAAPVPPVPAPEQQSLTNAQIAAGAEVLCDCQEPKRIGRSAAIAVFDAMSGQTQAHVLPPVAAPVSQHEAGASVLTDDQIDAHIIKSGVLDRSWPTQTALHAFARAIEAELASRCGAQGRVTCNKGTSDLAGTTAPAPADPMGDRWHSLTCDGTCSPPCEAASNVATAVPGDLPPLPKLHEGRYSVAELGAMLREYGRACIASNAGTSIQVPDYEMTAEGLARKAAEYAELNAKLREMDSPVGAQEKE